MKTYDAARTGASLRARDLRRNSTEVEKTLWRALREQLPDVKWRRQMPVGPYFVDIACFAARLVIELDGGQHGRVGEYDAARTRFIETQGYRVIRFWNNDVSDNIDGVLEVIAMALSSSPSRGSAVHPSPNGRGREARSVGRVRP